MSTEQLPPGWRKVKFGDVVRQVKDKVDPETAGIERYVAGEHMDTDDLRIRRWGEVGDGYLGPAFTMRFKPGQVLYGSRRTYLRKVALADFEGICANTTFVVESASEDLLPEFLPYVMTAEAFHEHSIKQSKGSVNPYINFSDLKWYEFALPPVEDQQRIIDAMCSVDRAVSRYQMAASSCSRWITAYFAESTSSCPTVRLADVASVDLGRQRAPKYETGPNMRPYIRAANLKDGRLSLDDVLSMHFNRDEIERLRLRKGDVLVTEGCGSLAEIGANAVWNEELPGEVCFQNTVLRLRARAGRLLQEYLQVWASQAYVRGEFADVASGTSIYHLGAKRTAKMLLPLPGPDEQRTIVARVQACQSVERESARSAEQLKSVRRDLLRKLMNEPSGGNVL